MKHSLPLKGKSVLIPRSGKQGKLLKEKIMKLGGTPYLVPLIEFREVISQAENQYVNKLQQYEWVIFTSQNGVNFFFQHLERLNKTFSFQTKIAAVGEKTKKAIEKLGFKVSFVPKLYSANDFAGEFILAGYQPKNVLIPKGNLAGDTIAHSLKSIKCKVDEWIVYETIFPSESEKMLEQLLDKEQLDYAMFTSPSTVRHFMEVAIKQSIFEKVKKIKMISIGPVTKKEIEGFGLTVAASPEKYTAEDMLECLYSVNKSKVMEEIQMNDLQFKRHRRLRNSANMRALVRETHLHVDDFIYPIFVVEGEKIKNEVPSMPGVEQISLDNLKAEMDEVVSLGIKSVLLFGIPVEKDEIGTQAFHDHGIVQEATRFIKEHYPDVLIVADTCLCEYTDHGHCGVIEGGKILNDPSLDLLAKTAVSQARAGADIIAPSNMMDGFVAAIRKGLDEAGFEDVPIMSYAVKYASAFYGPFRDAAGSSPQFGDRKTYQMDPANRMEALREAQSDVEEGADFLIVKPTLSYLDIVRDVRNEFNLPVVGYNVSGEYSMVKGAALNGWIDEKAIVLEMLTSMKRSGCDLIITYFAKDAARWLAE